MSDINDYSANKVNKLIKQHRNMSEFRDADKIIAFLDGDENADLPAKLKLKLEQYKFVQSLRMNYKTRAHIVGKLKLFFEIDTKEANKVVADAEYVFGKVLRIDRDYEKHFLIEMSKKNIQIAFGTGKTESITKALQAHQNILGPDPEDSDIPDFSAFEPHKYTFQLPKGLPEMLLNMLSNGDLDLSKVVPSQMVRAATKEAQDAQETTGDEA